MTMAGMSGAVAMYFSADVTNDSQSESTDTSSTVEAHTDRREGGAGKMLC
jgi:hypothetical protein